MIEPRPLPHGADHAYGYRDDEGKDKRKHHEGEGIAPASGERFEDGHTPEDAVRAAAVGLDPARIDVDATWSGARGAPVTVAVTYDAPVASLLAGWLLPESVSLRASATMRQEFA